MASPNDYIYSITRETVPGVTPATPAMKYLEALPGSDLSMDGTVLTSDVMKANRANAAAVLLNESTGGGLKFHGRRDTSIETLIEGVIGNAFGAGTSIKGGSNDYSHTIEQQMIEKSGGGAVVSYHRYVGQYVTKWTITVDAKSNVEYGFEFKGLNKTTSPTAIPSVAYSAATQGVPLNAMNVGAISIAGVTGYFSSLEITIEQPREEVFALSNLNAVAVGASAAPRSVKASLKMIRSSIAIDALAGNTVSMSVPLGTGAGNILTIACPKMTMNVPQNEVQGSSAIVAFDLTAVNDDTLGAEVSITKS